MQANWLIPIDEIFLASLESRDKDDRLLNALFLSSLGLEIITIKPDLSWLAVSTRIHLSPKVI